MSLSRLLLSITAFLFPFALLATTWLYTYPVWQGCGFPRPVYDKTEGVGTGNEFGRVAPFRLLALGDPQLEGSSSLPGGREVDVWGRIGGRVRGVWREEEDDSDTLFRQFPPRRRAQWRLICPALRDILTLDVPLLLQSYRKKVDLWGNDFYLAHIVRTMRWWARPTHVTVLGDLLGSQWIDDREFERRVGRYWGRVFRGMETVPSQVMEDNTLEQRAEDGQEEGEEQREMVDGPWTEVLDEKSWENRVINVVGNHDIGYAGDLNERRVERFEKAFGKVNWEIVFKLSQVNATTSSIEDTESGLDTQSSRAESNHEGEIPSLRLVILNSMNLDAPAYSESLQQQTYAFLNHIISTTAESQSAPYSSSKQSTILLTHIPLYKPAGLCVDSPFFDFWPSGLGVKEQNMLSDYVSKALLEGVFGLGKGEGRKGLVVNGHDHEGCDVLHYYPGTEKKEDISTLATDLELEANAYTDEEPSHEKREQDQQPLSEPESSTQPQPQEQNSYPFLTHRLPTSPSTPKSPAPPSTFNTTHPQPHLREITLRAMMGQYDGAAGLISAWWDPTATKGKGDWKFEVDVCRLGVQHWWWGVHVLDGLVLGGLVLGMGSWVVERGFGRGRRKGKGVEKKK